MSLCITWTSTHHSATLDRIIKPCQKVCTQIVRKDKSLYFQVNLTERNLNEERCFSHCNERTAFFHLLELSKISSCGRNQTFLPHIGKQGRYFKWLDVNNSNISFIIYDPVSVGSACAAASSTRAASEKSSSTRICINPAARRSGSRGARTRRMSRTSRRKRTWSWRKRKDRRVRACWRRRSLGLTLRRRCLSKRSERTKRSGDSPLGELTLWGRVVFRCRRVFSNPGAGGTFSLSNLTAWLLSLSTHVFCFVIFLEPFNVWIRVCFLFVWFFNFPVCVCVCACGASCSVCWISVQREEVEGTPWVVFILGFLPFWCDWSVVWWIFWHYNWFLFLFVCLFFPFMTQISRCVRQKVMTGRSLQLQVQQVTRNLHGQY